MGAVCRRLRGSFLDPLLPLYPLRPVATPLMTDKMALLRELIAGRVHCDPHSLSFVDSRNFVAGGVDASTVAFWEMVTEAWPERGPEIMGWVRDGVRVEDYFHPTKFGCTFRKRSYPPSRVPPKSRFKNHPVADPALRAFLKAEAISEVKQGIRSVVGLVSEVSEADRPWIVSPTGVEPSKPLKFDDCSVMNN